MKQVKTTVIGSYPVDIKNQEMMNNYFKNIETDWNQYIKKSVQDMINAGIDIISDGQTRDPFVNIYLRKIKGIRIKTRPEIVDKIQYQQPITLDDLKYVKKIIPENKEIIGLLAGPYTLTKSCVDSYYKDEKQIAFDFAEVIAQEAERIQKHVNMISLDEPFYSVEMPEYACELIKKIVKRVKIPIRLHACGDVTKIIPNLIELPVDILSHEFKATENLIQEFGKYSFKQKICLGTVRSDDTRLETIDEIVTHIKKAEKILSDKIAQISPDCGLRLLPQKIAYQKLVNMVKGCEKVYGR